MDIYHLYCSLVFRMSNCKVLNISNPLTIVTVKYMQHMLEIFDYGNMIDPKLKQQKEINQQIDEQK